jgi:hypothetical protein
MNEENIIQNTTQQQEPHQNTKPNRQADVLGQTRLRPHSDTQDFCPLINPTPLEIDARIANKFIIARNNGLTNKVAKELEYRLRQLTRNCNLLDLESVKAYIAIAKTQKTKQLGWNG